MKKLLLILLVGLGASCISQAHVQLVKPAGGETFEPGETVTVEWQEIIHHTTLNWDLYFSVDGGLNWEILAMDIPVDVMSYQWTVPETETSRGRIKVVQDNDGTDYEDESGNFTITAGGISYDPLLADAGRDTAFCAGSAGSAVIGGDPAARGGLPPYQYSWSAEYKVGAVHFTASSMLKDTSVSNPEFKQGGIPDSVVLRLEVRDSNDSSDVDSVTVRLSEYTMCLGECRHEIRLGDSVQLDHCIFGGLPPYQYSWSPATGLSDPTLPNPWAKPPANTTYELTIIDSYGCQAVSNCKIFINTTGIEQVPRGGAGIRIYPNPGGHIIHVSFLGGMHIHSTLEIINSAGIPVMEIPVEKSPLGVDVSDFAPGIYLCLWKEGRTVKGKGRFLVK